MLRTICSQHFPGGECSNPEVSIGKRFASPKKQWTNRTKGAKRDLDKEAVSSWKSTPSSSRQSTPSSSRQVSPIREMSKHGVRFQLRTEEFH